MRSTLGLAGEEEAENLSKLFPTSVLDSSLSIMSIKSFIVGSFSSLSDFSAASLGSFLTLDLDFDFVLVGFFEVIFLGGASSNMSSSEAYMSMSSSVLEFSESSNSARQREKRPSHHTEICVFASL